jgi:hypothetical protein
MLHDRPPALDHWLYASRSTIEPAWAARSVDLLAIQSASRNADLGLTGALLFTGQCFVQALEGPPAALDAMRTEISRDRRHTGVVTLAEGPLAHRRFGDWSLAYSGNSIYLAEQVHRAIARDDGAPALMGLLQAFAIPDGGARRTEMPQDT